MVFWIRLSDAASIRSRPRSNLSSPPLSSGEAPIANTHAYIAKQRFDNNREINKEKKALIGRRLFSSGKDLVRLAETLNSILNLQKPGTAKPSRDKFAAYYIH